MPRYALGFDYGTESVRVLVVDVASGHIAGQAVQAYRHGVLDTTLPSSSTRLAADYAFQHPQDWLDDLGTACRAAVVQAKVTGDQIVGIGVDFTSCTMMPALRDGTPLCMVEKFRNVPLAWPKLWKHHGAKAAVDRINQVARDRREPWLARYGGTIGIEWFFPKILETLTDEPTVYDATEVWLEGGDWLVWQLTQGPFPRCDAARLVRSTCQAGYKGCWNRHTGFPSRDYFAAVDPRMADVVGAKMPGTLQAPGTAAGTLSPTMAQALGLPAGLPVSTAIIDAHAGLPGSGVSADDTLVMVIGTSSCHMMNSAVEKLAPGIAGVVEDGILPGSFGYETGQSSVGDAFAWLVKTFNLSHEDMSARALKLAPGSGGVLALDWLNGCRTPLMDGRLSGAFAGLTLTTRPEQMYRALVEATAFGVRWIVDTMRDGGIPVRQFVASGGLPRKSPLLSQIYADVLNAEVRLAESDQSVALGAAILGALVAGQAETGHATVGEAIRAMAPQTNAVTYQPRPANVAAYDKLYALYRSLARVDGELANAMRALRAFA